MIVSLSAHALIAIVRLLLAVLATWFNTEILGLEFSSVDRTGIEPLLVDGEKLCRRVRFTYDLDLFL
jgi:hypothetical protein